MGVKGKRRSMSVGLAGLAAGMAAGLLTGSAHAGDGSGGGSGDGSGDGSGGGSGDDTPYATIEFRADKTTAAVGETVRWEVRAHWGVRAEDVGAVFRGFTGALLANPRNDATITSYMNWIGSESFPEIISGASVESLSIYQFSLLGTDDPANPMPLCTFDTVINGDSTPLWYDASGAAGVDVTIFTAFDFCTATEVDCPWVTLGIPIERYVLSVRTDVVNWRGCDATDAAPPFGVKDAADIGEFVRLLGERQPVVDFAEPFGVYDLHDIVGFIDRFTTPCE